MAIMAKKTNLKHLMDRLEKEELVNIIMNVAAKHPEIEQELLFLYESSDNEIAHSEKFIKQYIKQAKAGGFIRWNKAGDACYGAEIILEKVEEKLEAEDYQTGVLLSITVLKCMVDMLDYCDDSHGNVGDVIRKSLIFIETAAHDCKPHDEKQLFVTILKEALHPRYEEWSDWRFDLMSSCLHFCHHEFIREQFEKIIIELIKSYESKKSSSQEYRIVELKKLQLEMLLAFETQEKTVQFIFNNMEYPAFREMGLNLLLEAKEYNKVIDICLQSEKNDSFYRGLVHKWKQMRLQAYIGLGDIPKQKELLLEFLYNDEFEAYAELKKLYDHDEWPTTVEKILFTFEQKHPRASAYVEILKAENLTEKLLAYCEKYVVELPRLYPHLLERYTENVDKLFVKLIKNEAQKSSNRNQYKSVCKLIKLYQKVCGTPGAESLISYLKQMYFKRPAFVDELGKLK